jgi:hypothetical protein
LVQCCAFIKDLSLIGPNQVNIGAIGACKNLESLMIKDSGIKFNEVTWASYPTIKTLRLEGVRGNFGDMRGSMIEKVFISHIRSSAIEIVGASNLWLLNLKNLTAVNSLKISGVKLLRVLALQDAKSLKVIDISAPIETLFLHRTSKSVAKVFAKTRPERLSIEGRYEYKNESEAKSDYPDSVVSME